MPGFLLHLTEGQLIIDNTFQNYDREWKKQFMLGTVLPDFCSREEKMKSHFWKPEAVKHFYRVPDTDAFQGQYQADIRREHPVILGVYAHLMLDKSFYSEYWRSILQPVDSEGRYYDVWDDELRIRMNRTNVQYKKDRFFSDEILYGDYTKLNSYFRMKYTPYIPDAADSGLFTDCCSFYREIPEFDLKEMLGLLHHYIYDDRNSDKEDELLVFDRDILEAQLMKEALRFSEFR